MNQSKHLLIYKYFPYLYSLLFGTILIPMYLEEWFNIEIFSLVILMCILVFFFTKFWIKKNNLPYLIISFILLLCYPLKYAYIYFLLAKDNTFIIDAYFDHQQTNYLNMSNNDHILFIGYVISAFLGLFSVSFFTYKLNFKSFKFSFEKLAKNKNLNLILANKTSNYFFLCLTILVTILYTNFRVGIVSDQEGFNYILPFGLSTIIQITQKYIVIIYGFVLIYFNKIRNVDFNIRLITKSTLYLYILFTSLYTTSKEYAFILFIGLTIEIIILKFKKFKSKKTTFLIKSFLHAINLLVLGFLILFTIQARLVRNTTLCSDCGGVEAIFFLFDFLIKNQGFEALWNLAESFNAEINLFNTVLLSTVFRLQGAACLIRIMDLFHSNPVFSSPDLFGFFESITTLRQSGSAFFADIINEDISLGGAGVAFAPSFIGSSLQISNSIFNPFIFTFSSCFLFLNLAYLLTKSNFPLDIIFAIIISFDFVKGLSEGSFSYLFPLLGIISFVVNNFILNNNKFSMK